MMNDEEEGEVGARHSSVPLSSSPSPISRAPARLPLQISLRKGRGFTPQFDTDDAADLRYAGKVPSHPLLALSRGPLHFTPRASTDPSPSSASSLSRVSLTVSIPLTLLLTRPAVQY